MELDELGGGQTKRTYSIFSFTPDKWDSPGKANQTYHPGAIYEMCSQPTKGGHGNQCTYDKNGKLMNDPKTQGGAPGSADKYSPTDWSQAFNHYFNDVVPYNYALDADGGVPGKNVERYYDVRPPVPRAQ